MEGIGDVIDRGLQGQGEDVHRPRVQGDQGAIQTMEAMEGAVVMNPVLAIRHREAALLIQDLQPHHTVESRGLGGDRERMT